MPHYNTLFQNILRLIPRHHFQKFIADHQNDKYSKTFSSWNQLTSMLGAQAAGWTSLREIENSLQMQSLKLYHLGLPQKICRNTLSNANRKRDWRIYRSLFYKLSERCKKLTPKHKFKFKNPLYALDATTTSLCFSTFDWARIKHKKGAIKLHCALDYNGEIPSFMVITKGDVNDVVAAKAHFRPSRDSIYCFDRGYSDTSWFRQIDEAGAYFVTRLRSGVGYRVLGQHKTKGDIISDEKIKFNKNNLTARLIKIYDKEKDMVLEFITNNTKFSAKTIAEIYKARWEIEIFFRWIKQNLRIKTFLGTNRNAVFTQIWTAMIYYLLLAYIKYQSRYGHSLYYLGKMIRAALMERLNVIDLMNLSGKRLERLDKCGGGQMMLPFG